VAVRQGAAVGGVGAQDAALAAQAGGVNRVLHSAAALREQYGLRGERRGEFQRAYAYLRDRMGHLRYADCRRWVVPPGSGVAEASCKTVHAQRLKLRV
jgi:hypothetical protein